MKDLLSTINLHPRTAEHSLTVSEWEQDGLERAYLTRRLSGGNQEVGYVEMDTCDGEVTYVAYRLRSTVHALAVACGMEE